MTSHEDHSNYHGTPIFNITLNHLFGVTTLNMVLYVTMVTFKMTLLMNK